MLQGQLWDPSCKVFYSLCLCLRSCTSAPFFSHMFLIFSNSFCMLSACAFVIDAYVSFPTKRKKTAWLGVHRVSQLRRYSDPKLERSSEGYFVELE